MKFSKETEERILSAFIEKLPERRLICPLCQHEQWILSNGFLLLPISDEPDIVNPKLPGRGILTVALSCTTCGNTHVINLLNLKGLESVLDKDRIIADDINVKF